MTTTDPTDARASVWIAAFDTIRAAQKLKVDPRTGHTIDGPLPDLYWSLMAEAAIFADLARADFQTGFTAGTHLVARDERIRANRDRMARVVAEAKSRAAQRHPHRAAADAMHKPIPTGSTEAGPGIPTFVGDVPGVPRDAVGMRVRVTTGDWAGLNGTITAAYLRNEPPMLDVQLDLPPDALFDDKPTTICVRVADVELDGVGFVR